MNQKKIIAMILVYGLCGIAANLAHPVTPTLFNIHGFGSKVFGYAFSMMSFANFAFSYLWSNLYRKYYAKFIVSLCCISYAIAQILFINAHTTTSLLLARFLAGAFVSGLLIGIPFYMIQYVSEEERSSIITKVATAFSFGGTLGYFLGGLIGNTNIYIPLYTQVIVLLICGISFFFIMEKNKITSSQASIKSKTIITYGQYIALVLTFLVWVSSTSLTQTYAFYLINILKVKPVINGITKGVVGLIALLLNLFVTIRLLKSSKKEKYFKVYLALVAIMYCTLLLNFRFDLGFIISGIIIMSLETMHLPILQSICVSYNKNESKTEIISLQNAARSCAMIIGAYISGIAFEFNVTAPFVIATISIIIAFMLSLKLREDIH